MTCDHWCFRRGGVLGCQSDSRHSRYVAVILKLCHKTDTVRIFILWGDCYHAGMFKCEVDRQLWYGSRYWYLNHVLLGCAGQSSAEAGRMIALFLGSVKALDLTGDGTLKRQRIIWQSYLTSFSVQTEEFAHSCLQTLLSKFHEQYRRNYFMKWKSCFANSCYMMNGARSLTW